MTFAQTPAVERAFAVAEKLADQEGLLNAESRHVLLGLLHEEEGQASVLLAAAGVDPQQVRTHLASLSLANQPLDAILVRARHLASTLCADRTIASDQLLLAI